MSECEWCDGQDSPGEHENGCRLGVGPSEVNGDEANDFVKNRARQHLARWHEDWLYHREDEEREAGFGHHMDQMLARLPRDGQTRDMKRSIEQMIREYEILLNAVEKSVDLRGRMEALADQFDAKGRRGSARFGADVGDTIRLWIDRDPRVPEGCNHKPEHVTSDGVRWPLTCDSCRT